MRIYLLGLLASSCAVAPCLAASAQASASLSNFSYTLTDLAPEDGSAASFTSVSATYTSSVGVNHDSRDAWFQNAPSSAALDIGTITTSASTTRSANIAEFSLGEEFLWVLTSSETRTGGLLSAHTSLTFTALAQIDAFIDTPYSALTLIAVLSGGGTSDKLSAPGSQWLSITVTNDGDSAAWISFSATASAQIYDVPPGSGVVVPEPASYALMLAGLAVAGTLARRRARSRNSQ